MATRVEAGGYVDGVDEDGRAGAGTDWTGLNLGGGAGHGRCCCVAVARGL